MDYSILFIGVFAGLILGVIFIAAGIVIGRVENETVKGHNRTELRDDNSSVVLLPWGSGVRSTDNRYCSQVSREGVVIVLNTILHDLGKNITSYEKECIKYAISEFEGELKDEEIL